MSKKEEKEKKKEPTPASPTEMEPLREEEVEPPEVEEAPPEAVEIPPPPKPEEAPPPPKKEVAVVDITELITKELTKAIEKVFEPPWGKGEKLLHWDDLADKIKEELEKQEREMEYVRVRRCLHCGNWTPSEFSHCVWCGARLK
jgi:hypothetical protein